MEECAVFSHVVESGVHSGWNVKGVSLCVIYPRDHDKEHYTLLKFCTVYSSLFFIGFIM